MLLNMQGGLRMPADVLRFPLLHLGRWDDWSRWLALIAQLTEPKSGRR